LESGDWRRFPAVQNSSKAVTSPRTPYLRLRDIQSSRFMRN